MTPGAPRPLAPDRGLVAHKKLWEDGILTVYDADLGEGLYGLTRARAALEGTVRKNLKELVQRLAKRIETLSDRRE